MSFITLRFIIDNIKPQKLANTAFVSFKPIQDMMYLQLLETTIESDLEQICSEFTLEQRILTNKMWDCIKLYQIVNAFSYFLLSEIINKNMDDITPTEMIEKFNKNWFVYLDAVRVSSLEYVKTYGLKGSEYISNKELSTRILLANILQDLFLQANTSAEYVGVSNYSIGGLTSSAIDASVDKFNTEIVPYLNSKDIVSYFCDNYRLVNYFFPLGLEYFTKNAENVLGVHIPTFIPQFPPTDDIPLQNFCKNLISASPAEQDTGKIYFGLFGIDIDSPIVILK